MQVIKTKQKSNTNKTNEDGNMTVISKEHSECKKCSKKQVEVKFSAGCEAAGLQP